MRVRWVTGVTRSGVPIVAGLALMLSPLAHARAQQVPAQAPAPRGVVVTGTVYDSVSHAPLAGADVQLVDAAERMRVHSARSDSSGHFAVTGVTPGDYIVGFFHPVLDALGVALSPLRVTVPAGGTDIALAIPGGRAVLPAACGTRAPRDSSGAIAGMVRDASTGAPVGDAAVVVTWNEIRIDAQGLRSERMRRPVTSSGDGTFLACDLPGGDTVVVSAGAHGVVTGLVEVAVPALGVTWRDLTVGDSASVSIARSDSVAGHPVATVLHGAARLRGVVRDARGAPASGARVFVWGTGLSAQADSAGRFTLAGLPAGTFSVEARALGFTPARVPVDLTPRREAAVSLTLDKAPPTLARVTVYGRQSRGARDIDEFLARQRRGFGHFITAADIERHAVLLTSDALRMTPGVTLASTNGFGNAVLFTHGGSMGGRCAPVVYLDGMQMFEGYKDIDDIVQPSQIAGIEVYTGLGGAPAQYASNGCGSLLIWTKR